MKIEQSMQIAARPEKVWTCLTDPEKIRQWYFTLKKFEFAGDQKGCTGTLIHIEDRVDNRDVKVEARVTEWKDTERLAFQMTSGQGVKTYNQWWTVEKSSYGTRMTLMANVELDMNLLAKIGDLFRRGSIESDINKMLNKLRDLAETTHFSTKSAA